MNAERKRLADAASRASNWKRWGPYLSERQWGTVREDYSEDGEAWSYLSHDQANSRAYRWGEDGLLGFTDRECRLCFALALWNGKDPILKERLFGLTGPQGNHGEDVKECYYYLDSTPTHSYASALYKYPQAEFPYAWLLDENRRRGKTDPEFELTDTGVFNDNRYFDVKIEYAKAASDDILILVTVSNRGSEAATISVLPTLWFRNTWSWGRNYEGHTGKPALALRKDGLVEADHPTLGRMLFAADSGSNACAPTFLFTENDTNIERVFGSPNDQPFVKDAFHQYVIHGNTNAVNAHHTGTKFAALYQTSIPGNSEITIRLRLCEAREMPKKPFADFDNIFAKRLHEANEFYEDILSHTKGHEARSAARQAYAGVLWSKQFYHYVVKDWLDGDPAQPLPPASRRNGRNKEWQHLFNRDVISMPDKWEYPWYAAWDLAFHMIPLAKADPDFAKEQLILFLREWYMHPNGQLPAYEFALGDVNPPVHAWAVWRVYKMTGPKGGRDVEFLARCFHKLLLNFTWWVNRKDPEGKNLFAGGFLGLDNIGVFDRSQPLPGGTSLDQADGTAWMAFYCVTMLAIAIELAHHDPAYEDVASKFFEHFMAIADAMNSVGGDGLWDEEDGFYYDKLTADGQIIRLKIRSLVGVIPLFSAAVLEENKIKKLPGFRKRTKWFLENRGDLTCKISCMKEKPKNDELHTHLLLAIPSEERLKRVLRYILDESEFLSPYGIRSVSKFHDGHPYVFHFDGQSQGVRYTPGESDTGLFGGNSNWRGPIWFPLNFLLIEALESYHYFYGDNLKVECPVGSGNMMNLKQAAAEIARRLASIFLPDENGRRPVHADDPRYASDPNWKNLVLFYEYFQGDTGRGMGASHQTGWTALVAKLMEMGNDTPKSEGISRAESQRPDPFATSV